jgi:CheY-like chemotaxis protein
MRSALMLRGAEAMRGEGVLSVETSGALAADPTAASRATLAPGHYVQIAIRDTGHAIHSRSAPANLRAAGRRRTGALQFAGDLQVRAGDGWRYDRHQRVRSRHLLHNHVASGSRRTAHARRGRGCSPTPAPAITEPVRAETILVVEDEAGIRGRIRRILSRQNYTVIEASNGRQALEIAREHPG